MKQSFKKARAACTKMTKIFVSFFLCSFIWSRILDRNRGTYEKARGIQNLVLQRYTQNFMNGQSYQLRSYAKKWRKIEKEVQVKNNGN